MRTHVIVTLTVVALAPACAAPDAGSPERRTDDDAAPRETPAPILWAADASRVGSAAPVLTDPAAEQLASASNTDAGAPDAAGVAANGAALHAPSPCHDGEHAICLDFESGKLEPGWTSSGVVAVDATRALGGRYALHFPKPQSGRQAWIRTTQLGPITNVVWGRFYIYLTGGAPVGHGAIVNAYDQAGDWYALGFEFNSYFGNWHPPSCCPEKYMRSRMRYPANRWVCVEFTFDGATPRPTQIWGEGQPITFTDVSTRPGPNKVTQFRRIEIGFSPYHSVSLTSYDGNTPPYVGDVWIDDVVIDTKRVGCN